MEEKKSTPLMLLLLYGMLIAALLVLAVAGVKLYGASVSASDAHARSRSALGYIQSQVANCQGSTGAYLSEGPEGVMLCLPETDGKFETRIYLSENSLLSEFSQADSPVNPENGESICTISELDILWLRDGLLEITADGSTAYAAVTGGGGHE